MTNEEGDLYKVKIFMTYFMNGPRGKNFKGLIFDHRPRLTFIVTNITVTREL